MKKKISKLSLQKETIANLQDVVAGALPARPYKTTDTAGGNVSQTCQSNCACQA